MAYRIEYGPPRPPARRDRLSFRLPFLTCVFFAAFLLAVKAFWPAGQEALTRLLLPLQATAESRDAISAFVSDLREGHPFREALTAFCQQIISYADIPSV